MTDLPLHGFSPHSRSDSLPIWVKQFRANGTPSALPAIRQAVVEAAQECRFNAEEIVKIEMAVGEACSNIIEHAYSTQPLKHELEVQITCFQDRLEVLIQDYASINFAVSNASTVQGLDDWVSLGKRRGLGIFIIQTFVDKVEHRFVCGQGNELKLIKFFA